MMPAMTGMVKTPRLMRAIALPQGVGDDVHLWLVDLDQYDPAISLNDMQEEELARADAFHFPRDRRRYLAGRHALRTLLAASLHLPPANLRLVDDAFGKPALRSVTDTRQFNVSHSGPVCVIALGASEPVGVDVELLQPLPDIDALAAAHFTSDEQRMMARKPAAARKRDFFQCWTRKEACLKAAGVGLTADARDVQAGCGTDCRKVVIPLGTHDVETLVWTLSIESIPDTIAALAVVPSARRRPDDLWSTAA